MSKENILYVPIQINGGDENQSTVVPESLQLLDRELYVLKDGTLYVGVQEGEAVRPTVVVGNVVKGAAIENPTLSSPTIKDKLILGEGMLFAPDKVPSTGEDNQVIFVDMGKYNPPAAE